MHPVNTPTKRTNTAGKSIRRAGFPLTLLLAFCAGAENPSETRTVRDLIHSDLEDLMAMQVTSVSKKEQTLSQAGAAVYVITQADIRSSGATNIPDLLRMVPGVVVARIDANSWAISIRGFNDRYANKVLVLVDGRSVYSSSFSGVFWDAQDMPLEDIERIEIIRGPGGTVWGANAVNGVINVITKSAKNTKGALITTGAGSETRADGLARYGGSIGSKGAYRIFGRYSKSGSTLLPDRQSAGDAGQTFHSGFRTDWDLSSRDSVTVQGDAEELRDGETYSGVFSSDLPRQGTINARTELRAGNVLGRWSHTLANGSETTFQIYDDYSHRIMEGLLDGQNTVDLDFQDHLTAGTRHDIVWGLGSRVTTGHFRPGYSTDFTPRDRVDTLFSAFIQDEFQLTGSLALTVGSKFEHNNYTGFEYQPSAQLVWSPARQHTLWLSASRAIRQPNVLDAGLAVDAAIFPVPGVPFALLRVLGSPDSETETLHDFEAGYRAQANQRLSLDLATFLSFYDDLRSAEPKAPYFTTNPGPPHLVFPLVLSNLAQAHNYGAEVFLNWSVSKRWRISPGYSLIHMIVNKESGSGDTEVADTPGFTPKHQFQMRSSLNLPHHLEWDGGIYYVSRLDAPRIPSYMRVDTRLGWHWSESVDFSLVGQNLLGPHEEFADSHGLNHTRVERSIFGKITWRF